MPPNFLSLACTKSRTMATYTQIMADLQKRQFKPVYFLSGEESYYIDSISDYIEKNLLKEEEKAFNQTVMYGADVQMSQIIDAAKRYPMMSEYTLVIVKEAQEVDGMDGSPEEKAAMLASYIEHPQPLTVLVICMKGGKLDSRRKFAKTVSQKTEYFVSEPLKEEKVGAWIIDYLKDKNLTIDPKAAELMAANMGAKLSNIVTELDKLKANVAPGGKITLDDIERHVGISKDFNVFELQKAIGMRDVYRSALIAKQMGSMAKFSIIPVVASLYGYFTKVMITNSLPSKTPQNVAVAIGVPPFFANEYIVAARNFSGDKCPHIISILREYDAYSKGIDSPSIDGAELLREMVFKILNA